MGNNYNDKARGYGSRTVNICRPSTAGASGIATTWSAASGNRVNVVMENISVNRPTRQVNVYDEAALPSDSFAVPDFVTGSATAQVAKTTDAASSGIQPGDGFLTTFDADIGVEHFVVVSVDAPFAQLEYFKQNIQFKKLYGAATGIA